MRAFCVLVVLLVAGCTAPNPDYVADSGSPATGNDLSMAGCPASGRDCLGANASATCENGVSTPDRTCPAGSTCGGGYCGAPTPINGMQTGDRCDGSGGPQELQCRASASAMLSCQPFAVGGGSALIYYCDHRVGTGGAGASCTRGGDCASGACTTGGVCFYGCHSDFECVGSSSNLLLTCSTVSFTIEGVTTSNVKSCVPN